MKHYFTTLSGNNWRFYCTIKDKEGHLKPLYLKSASATKIRRHVKLKSEATPFNPVYKDYFKKRDEEQKRRKTIINFDDSAGLKTIQPY
ncbi:MAG: hypothetical protein Q8Q56_04840 [Alphaproteobacteria bacterium]|nr:hypothetical protein [Alphaproteobacteria bacterium]